MKNPLLIVISIFLLFLFTANPIFANVQPLTQYPGEGGGGGLIPKHVIVSDAKLYVNGSLYEAKHVGYLGYRAYEFGSEYGACTCDPDNQQNPFTCQGSGVGEFDLGVDRIRNDLDKIRSLNANGIRTWGKVNWPLLNELRSRGMMVAATIPLPWDGNYSDPQVRQSLITDIVEHYISIYKNHPAILFWILGNEVELHIAPSMVPDYFDFIEQLTRAIKAVDSHHPVATAVAWNPTLIGTYDSHVPSLDIWAVNTYTGDTFTPPGYPGVWADYANVSNKAHYIAEYEVDNIYHRNPNGNFNDWYVDESGAAAINANLAQEIRTQVEHNYNGTDPIAKQIGGAFFQFNDQWWKTSSWADACSHDVDPDGWFRPGHDGYDDAEYSGIYESMSDGSLRERPLGAALRSIWAN